MGTAGRRSEEVIQMADRYSKNPFLRLVDCYVLDAIGQLPSVQQATLEQLEPRFRKTLNAQGGWREMVETRMQFSADVKAQIREFWAGYKGAASQQGVEANAIEFVVDFVNQNFPFLLEEKL